MSAYGSYVGVVTDMLPVPEFDPTRKTIHHFERAGRQSLPSAGEFRVHPLNQNNRTRPQ